LCDYHPLVIKPLGSDLEWSIDGSIQRVQKVCHPVGDYNKIGILVKFCFQPFCHMSTKLSKINVAHLHKKVPGCLFHATFNHSGMSSSVAHPIPCRPTIIPCINLSFGRVFF
jgi:hypothetical protein